MIMGFNFQSIAEYIESNQNHYHKNKLKLRLVELSNFFNVSPVCTDFDLHRLARKLMVKYHPDKPDGDIEKFNEVWSNFNELREIRGYIYDDQILPAVISNDC